MDLPVNRQCRRCGVRYKQAYSYYCRHCQRELGDYRTTREREEVKVIEQREALARVTPPPPPPRPVKTITIRGQEFEIMFDGT